jgi:hypothetical protein
MAKSSAPATIKAAAVPAAIIEDRGGVGGELSLESGTGSVVESASSSG